MENYYSQILLGLAKKQVRFVVAGGVAGVLHGVERVTMDINIALDWEEENVRLFLNVMDGFGMTPRAPVPPEFILSSANREIMVKEKNALVFTFIDLKDPLKHVDVFLMESHSFPELIKSSVEIQIEQEGVSIISMEKLLALKQEIDPPRSKDLYDIAELKRLLKESNGN